MTSAGRFRTPITIFRIAEVDNGRGGYTNQVQPVADVRAEVTGLGGSETVVNQVLQGISLYSIRIRYRTDVDAACQIRYGAVALNIKSAVDPDGRRRELVITAGSDSTLAS